MLPVKFRNGKPIAVRIDQASRMIAASPREVFRAFVEPHAIIRWLPPAGASAVLEEFDPRPGGAFRMTLTFDHDGSTKRKTSQSSDTVDGRFVEIVEPVLIRQEFLFISEYPEFAGLMTMIWTFESREDGTCVSIRAEHVPSGIGAEEHEAGMKSSLANLARFVET